MKQNKIIPLTLLLFICLFPENHIKPSRESQRSITHVTAPIAIGELVDKITILIIKKKKITSSEKRKNVLFELQSLLTIFFRCVPQSQKLTKLTQKLYGTNRLLWDIEDAIRVKETKKEFDNEFIHIARQVYHINDHRVALKNKINHATGCRILEEKQYTEY